MPKPRKIDWTNADGTTTARWEVRYRDGSGRRRSKSFRLKKDADRFGETVVTGIASGEYVPDRDTVTVAEAADRWLAAVERGRDGREPVEPHTLRAYRSQVETHIKPLLGSLRLNRLTPARVAQFRDADLLGKGVSRAMTKKLLTTVSAICTVAIGDQLLGVNPCKAVRIVTSSRHREAVTIPSKADVGALLTRARQWVDDPLRASPQRGGRAIRMTRHRALLFYTLLRFTVFTGCRMSEVRGAPWADYDPEAMIYSVRQRADERNRLGAPKSASGRRDLELTPAMCADIERWRAVAPKTDLIFGTAAGSPLLLGDISRRLFLPLMRECGLTFTGADGRERLRFSPHDLRHFHASVMIEAGMQAKELQSHMGHSSIKVTLDIYGHLFKDDAALARRRAVVTGAMNAIDGPAAPLLIEG